MGYDEKPLRSHHLFAADMLKPYPGLMNIHHCNAALHATEVNPIWTRQGNQTQSHGLWYVEPHMPPTPQAVLATVEQIEDEMKHIGLWQAESLKPEQYNFQAAFAMDTMTFSQWLQFIFIPKVREAAAAQHFPSQSQVAAQAIREFDGFSEAASLITVLAEFDALF